MCSSAVSGYRPATMNTDQLVPLLISYGTKVLGAIALWVVGGAIINFAVSRVEATASKANLDATTSS